MNGPDLHDLAAERLDGLLSDAEWATALATHGAALEAAVADERRLRATVAGLPRAELPPALRESLLAIAKPETTVAPAPVLSAVPPTRSAAPALRPRWGLWGSLSGAALAAGLAFLVIGRHDFSQPEPAPEFARRPAYGPVPQPESMTTMSEPSAPSVITDHPGEAEAEPPRDTATLARPHTDLGKDAQIDQLASSGLTQESWAESSPAPARLRGHMQNDPARTAPTPAPAPSAPAPMTAPAFRSEPTQSVPPPTPVPEQAGGRGLAGAPDTPERRLLADAVESSPPAPATETAPASAVAAEGEVSDAVLADMVAEATRFRRHQNESGRETALLELAADLDRAGAGAVAAGDLRLVVTAAIEDLPGGHVLAVHVSHLGGESLPGLAGLFVLEGLDAAGEVAWRSLLPTGTQGLEAGETRSLRSPLAALGIPPGIRALRLVSARRPGPLLELP